LKPVYRLQEKLQTHQPKKYIINIKDTFMIYEVAHERARERFHDK
jgi:hypothetical protein